MLLEPFSLRHDIVPMNRPWNETYRKLMGDGVYSLCQLSFEGLRGFRLPLKRSQSSLFYAAMSPDPLDWINGDLTPVHPEPEKCHRCDIVESLGGNLVLPPPMVSS